MNLPFFIARRYLVKQKGTFSSFIIKLAILATALSVAVMIVAVAVVTGFQHSVSEKLYSFMGHVHVEPFDETNSGSLTYSQPILYNHHLMDSIRQVPHVTGIAPFVVRPVIVQAHGLMEGIQLKGVEKGYHLSGSITTVGRPIDYSDTSYSKEIMLSQSTADRLNVNLGEMVQLYFVESGSSRIRKVKVSGIYHSGMEEVDRFFGICDMRLIQHINGWSADSVNGFEVRLDNPAHAEDVAAFIHYNLIKAPQEAYTTKDIYSSVFDWLDLQNINSTILIIIMTIVATINMGAVLLILMVDRARMIGLLKALGMPFEQTRNLFLAVAAIIAAAGILLGNVLGVGLCWLQLRFGLIKLPEDIYYMKYAPMKLIWWQVALIDVSTLVICVLCMWLPALYIRRVQPVKVLQFK